MTTSLRKGCIGLAIARRVKDARVTLGDVSPAALRVARQNVGSQRLSGRVKGPPMYCENLRNGILPCRILLLMTKREETQWNSICV